MIDRLKATALAVFATLALPLQAQTDGVWHEDLAALFYPPEVVGGYWDAGYEFDFTMFCSPGEAWLNVAFGFVNRQPSPEDGTFFVQLGDRRFDIPWIDSTESRGSVAGYFPNEASDDPWEGQHDFIQRLLDGHALQMMEGVSVDDANAVQLAVAAPAPGLGMFQNLSQTCGSGVVTPQVDVAPAPVVVTEGPATWVLGAGTELWDGLTAFSPSDNGEARAFIHCGSNGLAEFVLRVTDADAPADTNGGAAFIGPTVFDIVAGRIGGAYVFDVEPAMIGAMMTGRELSFDSLIPVYEEVDNVVTFSLTDVRPILEQALAPCAATALP